MVWFVGTAARAAVMSARVAMLACVGLLVGLTLGPAVLGLVGGSLGAGDPTQAGAHGPGLLLGSQSLRDALGDPSTASPGSSVLVDEDAFGLARELRARFATLDGTLDRILQP